MRVAVALAFIMLLLPSLAATQDVALRTVSVRVAVDEQYRAKPDWETDLRAVVGAVSATWERRYGIRWEIGAIVPWTSPSDLGLGPRGYGTDQLVHGLPRGDEEVVLVVSGRRCSEGWRGAASPFGDTAVVFMDCPGWRGPLAPRERVVSHELAHLFGAFHVTTPSLMNAKTPSDAFDDQTDRVIRLMREFRFSSGIEGVDPATRHAWLAIFAEGHAADEHNLIARALRDRGMRLARAKQYEAARLLLAEALGLDPRLAVAHVDLGVIAGEQGRFEHALAEFRTAITIDPTLAGAHAGLGKALIGSQRSEEGLRSLQAAVALGPARASFRVDLGRGLELRGKLPEAMVEYRKAVDLDPGNAHARRYLGDLLLRQGRFEDAEHELRAAIRLEPESALSHALLGAALGAEKRLDEAAVILGTAVRLDPSLAMAHANLGYVHAARGEWTAAVTAYREALRLAPSHLATRVNLASAHVRQGHLDEAVIELREVLRLAPDAEAHRLALGRVLIKLRKPEEAAAEFREVLRRNPRAAVAHYHLAQIYAATRRYADAWHEVGRAEALGLRIPAAFVTALDQRMPRPATR